MTSRSWAVSIIVLAIVAAAVYATPHLEGVAPEVVGIEPIALSRSGKTIRLELSDVGTGLRGVQVLVLRTDGVERSVMERRFEGELLTGGSSHREILDVPLDVVLLELPDGDSTVVVIVWDWSWRSGLEGNRVEHRIALRVDTVAPRIDVESGLTYVYRGGSGAVTYKIAEAAVSDGVQVGNAFFPGHPIEAGAPERRIALFAIPVDAEPDPAAVVTATDAAGNAASATFPLRVFERTFERRTITLSPRFLERTVGPLAEANGARGSDPAELFRHVNETIRARDEEKIRELVTSSSSTRYWQGAFEQMRGSKVTSRFAERRSYQIDGADVSQATHYGFDLASTAGADVSAANGGVVAWAGDLGIYGRCVLIDHGQGLSSLYGHLSQIDVAAGDAVEKGQRVGRSGSTGLAGGDHLHFAILVGGQYVDPLEWWDPKWVQSHVEVRLGR